MKKQEKIFEVENLTQKIKGSKSLVLADYRGLTANQFNELRKLVKKAGGELQVVKNTLLTRALMNLSIIKKSDDLALTGPSLAIFSPEDEIGPTKALVAFGKNLSLLALKTGFMGENILSSDELMHYVNLPGKEELRLKLVGTLAQPSQRLVLDLNYNLYKLVTILKRVSEKTN